MLIDNQTRRGMLSGATLFVLFGITTGIGAYILSCLMPIMTRAAVGEQIPAKYPVLVVTTRERPGRCRADVVFHDELAKYLAAHQSHAYLVPREQENTFNRHLAHNARDLEQRPYTAEFRVKYLPDGRQRLRVTRFIQSRGYTGWYTADAKGVEPAYLTSYDTLVNTNRACGISLTANILLWAVGVYITNRRRRTES